ncbi:MAG: hypothetical protein DHS20C15_11930 [Planctomycetota bacterium]|nr:MAG: hypothetical protein DHS20C15_11930 [Planctomycetota bacterium]
MTNYRMRFFGLYSTGVTDQNDLHFERSPGVDFLTEPVDFTLLTALNQACNDATVTEGANLRQRLEDEANARVDAWLTSHNEPTEPWSVLVSDSKPSGGIWTPQTGKHFITLLILPEGANAQHVAVAQDTSDAADGTTNQNWFVSDVIVVRNPEGT